MSKPHGLGTLEIRIRWLGWLVLVSLNKNAVADFRTALVVVYIRVTAELVTSFDQCQENCEAIPSLSGRRFIDLHPTSQQRDLTLQYLSL